MSENVENQETPERIFNNSNKFMTKYILSPLLAVIIISGIVAFFTVDKVGSITGASIAIAAISAAISRFNSSKPLIVFKDRLIWDNSAGEGEKYV